MKGIMSDERKGLPSASTFDRVVFCPGSPEAERAVPVAPTVADIAAEGEAIHAAVAEDDLSELGLTAMNLANQLAMTNQQALSTWMQQNNFADVGKTVVEERFWFQDPATHEDIVSAKPDFVAIEGGQCLVIDDKSGFKRVTEAAGNWQLRVQLVALDQNLGPFSRARVAIAQHRLGSQFSICDYTRADIDQAAMEVVFYCRRAAGANLERVPGEHCRYCRAKASCPEYASYGMLPWSQAQLGKPMAKKDIYAKAGQLSLKDLAFIESRRSAAVNLFEAVKERLKTLDEKTLASLGYELKPTGFLRAITNLTELWEILEMEDLCSDVEFRSMCEISLSKLEELVVTRIRLKNQIGVEASEAIFNKLISPVVLRTPKAKALKPLVSVPQVGTRP